MERKKGSMKVAEPPLDSSVSGIMPRVAAVVRRLCQTRNPATAATAKPPTPERTPMSATRPVDKPWRVLPPAADSGPTVGPNGCESALVVFGRTPGARGSPADNEAEGDVELGGPLVDEGAAQSDSTGDVEKLDGRITLLSVTDDCGINIDAELRAPLPGGDIVTAGIVADNGGVALLLPFAIVTTKPAKLVRDCTPDDGSQRLVTVRMCGVVGSMSLNEKKGAVVILD